MTALLIVIFELIYNIVSCSDGTNQYLKRLEEYNLYKKAVELNPNCAMTRLDLGCLLVAEYKKAIEINPKDAKTRINLGLLLTNQFGDHDDALAEFKKAIEIDPKDKLAYKNLCILLTKHFGDHDGAFAAYKKFIELDPGNSKSQNFLANILTNHFGDGALGPYKDEASQTEKSTKDEASQTETCQRWEPPMLNECSVCMQKRANAVFVPCGHAICCYGCAQKMLSKDCPKCRKNVGYVWQNPKIWIESE